MGIAQAERRRPLSSAPAEERGRNVQVPSDIPRKRWRDILLRVLHRISRDNIAYGEVERRGYFQLTGIALMFTFGAIAGLLIMLTLGVALPILLEWIPVGFVAKALALALRWVLLWSFAAGSFALVYRFAPCRKNARWRWVTWGSVSAATLWLAVGLLFTLYARNFGSYGKTYGTLAGVMVLLMWFYLASFAVVLGAVLDAEMVIPNRSQSENRRSASPSSGR
jgi:membrane protein